VNTSSFQTAASPTGSYASGTPGGSPGFESFRKEVLICESQPVTAEGLRSLLPRSANLKFLQAVDTLAAAADLVRTRAPGLILLDKSFGIQTLLKWIGDLRDVMSGTALVVWGSSISEPEALRLLQGGVRGIIRKSAPPDLLLRCLESVIDGSNWMEDSLFREHQRVDRYPQFELTPREQQVLELVEQGMKNKEIAHELAIRPGTVKIHLKHIFEKTGVRGRYGLALSGLKEKGSVRLPEAN
jgi:two-component system nitrate/nitrite response regulator NarL